MTDREENFPSLETIRAIFTGSAAARDVTLQDAIDAFLRVEMLGKSEQTRRWYRARLELMADFLGHDRMLVDLMEFDLFEWAEVLEKREKRYTTGESPHPVQDGGLSLETRHGYIRAVKRLFRWLYRRGVLPADLAADIDLPRLPRRRGKKGVADLAVSRVLEAAAGNIRDYALISFIESTGCRRGGAAHLLLSDLNLDSQDEKIRRRVTVREKGGDERPVFMTDEALSALLAWLAVRPEIDDLHVFLGAKGRSSEWRPLTERGITEVFSRYKSKLGIEGKTNPHEWRHRWVRNLIRRGVGIKKASQLAGHKSVFVTDMYYSDLDVDELQDEYDRAMKAGKAD